MNDILVNMRHVEPADTSMLNEWRDGHGATRWPDEMLPKCGVVCEMNGAPVAALFLHMDNSCGVCLLEHAVTRPGLGLKTARVAIRHCIACLKKVARGHGYHTVAVFTYPSVTRFMERCGFSATNRGLTQMVASTEEGN